MAEVDVKRRSPLEDLARATEHTLATLHESVKALIEASTQHEEAASELKDETTRKKDGDGSDADNH